MIGCRYSRLLLTLPAALDASLTTTSGGLTQAWQPPSRQPLATMAAIGKVFDIQHPHQVVFPRDLHSPAAGKLPFNCDSDVRNLELPRESASGRIFCVLW